MIDPEERAIVLMVWPTRYEVLQTKRFWFWIKGRFMHEWTSIGWGAWRGGWRRTNQLRGVNAEDCATNLHLHL